MCTGKGQCQAPSQSTLLLASTVTCLVAGLSGWAIQLANGGLNFFAVACFLVSFLAGGWHTAREAWSHLLRGELEIDLLMVLAALGTAALGEWFEGAALLFLFSLSHTLETYIGERTRHSISALMKLAPETATLVRDRHEITVPAATLAIGDAILIRPGERIPADARITAGATSLDQSPVTGESQPVDRTVGETIFAGTLNLQGAIHAEVLKPVAESTIARMVKLVEEARAGRASSQQFSEWFGDRYSQAVLLITATIFVGQFWLIHSPFGVAFLRAMTFLVVASPCAVVISIPSAILSAISGAARQGILFKGGIHLERMATLTGFAFDKTGTLTVGRPHLIDLFAEAGTSPDVLLSTAAAIEARSEHPLARAVVAAAKERAVIVPHGEAATSVVARGMKGRVEGVEVRVGKPDWFGNDFPGPSETMRSVIDQQLNSGRSVMAVGTETSFLGILTVADTLRPTALSAIQAMKSQGVTKIVMLTGDRREVAAEIAKELDIEARAELLPENKVEIIREMKQHGITVGMMGDGMNDAPALAAADVGVSLGAGGTDVALETADVVLMGDDLRKIPTAIGLARSAQAVVRQNLVLAFGVMLALLVLTSLDSLALPWAVVGHEGSTVLVILNGLRLLRSPRDGTPTKL